MKKNKSRLKSHSGAKEGRKALEITLTEKFREIISQFGEVKKAGKTIERFSKQIARKLPKTTDQKEAATEAKTEKVIIQKPASKEKTVKEKKKASEKV